MTGEDLDVRLSRARETAAHAMGYGLGLIAGLFCAVLGMWIFAGACLVAVAIVFAIATRRARGLKFQRDAWLARAIGAAERRDRIRAQGVVKGGRS